MQWKTHMMGGLVTYTACIMLLPAPVKGLQILGGEFIAVVGALFPDVDLHTSKAGRSAGALSMLIEKIWGHRTLFHSPLLYVILYIALSHLDAAWIPYVHAFVIGVVSHLILDMLNKKGIPLLYPYSKRFHIAKIRTGGKGEWLVCGILVIIGGALIFRAVSPWVQRIL